MSFLYPYALFYYPAFGFLLVILIISLVIPKKKFDAKQNWFKVFFYIIEMLSIIALPLSGIYFNQDRCGEHPFDLDNLLTPYACWFFPAVAYYVSRYGKKQLPPLIIFLCSSALAFGFIYCAVTIIHFSNFLLFFWFPLLGAQILSPVLCFFLLGKELLAYRNFYSGWMEERKGNFRGGINSFVASVLASCFFKRNLAIAGIMLPFTVALQGILFLAGQAPDSLVRQFTESCGFLLSHHQSCTCGDHYLCSVAAFGDKSLVKPTRTGIRARQRILVNRQLLIANAFENWFEDNAPRLHRIMRRSYDALNIPADIWAQNKTVANFIYIAMKPAEWIFLLWLYLADKDPETRIERQYLPKAELEYFKQEKITPSKKYEHGK